MITGASVFRYCVAAQWNCLIVVVVAVILSTVGDERYSSWMKRRKIQISVVIKVCLGNEEMRNRLAELGSL